MNLFGAVASAVRSAVQSGPKPVSIDRAPAGPVSIPLPSPNVSRDTFEQLPRPRLDLGASVGPSGARASLELEVGAKKLELASASAGLGGVSVTAGHVTAEHTVKRGVGVSTDVFGDTLGAHFKNQDGPATLGAVSVKAGGQEVSVGLVPAAPSPIPVPVYAGKERK